MSENQVPDDVDEQYLSNFALAAKSDNVEAVAKLSKPEAAFYISNVLGVGMDEAHPSEHNGNVTKSIVRAWAQVLADYADRTGTDAFRADEVLGGDSDDSDDSDEGDN